MNMLKKGVCFLCGVFTALSVVGVSVKADGPGPYGDNPEPAVDETIYQDKSTTDVGIGLVKDDSHWEENLGVTRMEMRKYIDFSSKASTFLFSCSFAGQAALIKYLSNGLNSEDAFLSGIVTGGVTNYTANAILNAWDPDCEKRLEQFENTVKTVAKWHDWLCGKGVSGKLEASDQNPGQPCQVQNDSIDFAFNQGFGD